MKSIQYEPVEEVSLPVKYRTPGSSIPYHTLIVLYEELKKEHLTSLRRCDNFARGSWANERMIESQCDLLIAQQIELNRFKRLGQYRPGYKPPPEPVDDLSTVDESTT